MAFVKQSFAKIAEENLDDPWALSYESELTEDFIENNLDKIDWYWVLCKQALSEPFIKKHLDNIASYQRQNLPNDYNFGVRALLTNQKLSEEFIDELFQKFPDVLNINSMYPFGCISFKQKLSENFIRKYKNNLSWKAICMKQKLSESFMIEHVDHLDFKALSRWQKLSPGFILLHLDKIDFEMLCRNKKLSPESKKCLMRNSKKVVASLLAMKGRGGQ